MLWAVEILFFAVSTPALDGDEWLASPLASPLPPGKVPQVTSGLEAVYALQPGLRLYERD